MSVGLGRLIEGIDGAVLNGSPVEVTAVTQDSRAIEAGALYCCIKGASTDGHDLAPAVVQAGAGSLLVERWLDIDVPQVRVPSTRRAVGPVAAAFHGHPSARLDVIGVTGTNGKTTTVSLLASVLRAAGRPTGVSGTLTGARTTPEAPVLQARLAGFVEEGCRAVAMEVSSVALAQHRVDGIEFRAGVFTNLSQEHLDDHGDMEAYFAAKQRLFEPGRCALAVVNGDDRWGRRLLASIEVPAIEYGLADAGLVAASPSGAAFSWRGEPVDLPLSGAHNVSNALAAATVAAALGVDDMAIAAGLSAASVVPGRWETISAGQDFTVVVDYAHTPAGLEQVLTAARGIAGGRQVLVVFGCGGDRDRTKRPVMAGVATRLADVAILTSDNPRSEDPMVIIEEAAAGAAGPGALVIDPDRESAIAAALSRAAAGDVVVVAGKGHEQGQIIGDRVVPFDDREITRHLLERR